MSRLVGMCVRGMIGLMILIVLGVGVFATLATETAVFSSERHAEAPYVASVRNRGDCQGTEIWYSPRLGTVMLVCGLPHSTEYGIFIWRITENQGARILPQGEAYECTVFVGSYNYVQNKIKEGPYVALAVFPDIERAWSSYFGIGGGTK